MKPNKQLRLDIKTLQQSVSKKDAKEMVWIPIRGKYYRGISIDSKSKVKQLLGTKLEKEVKYTVKENKDDIQRNKGKTS